MLLQSIVDEWPNDSQIVAWIDIRARERLVLPLNTKIFWIRPSFLSRLKAEISLAFGSHPAEPVLFFHNLPPLLPVNGEVIVFLQNRILIEDSSLSNFSLRTRLRLIFERAFFKILRHKVDVYYVQTPSMAALLRGWYGGGSVDIRISSFAPPLLKSKGISSREWDFVYVSDGEAHKNHKTLVEGWIILGQNGIYPSLALTLSDRDKALRSWIDDKARSYNLNIIDLGVLSRSEVSKLYDQAGAMIFPSVSESFGLPLIEARSADIPILAGELDFVRDVCDPVECFDPKSAVSIARAVRRFLQHPEAPIVPESARVFLHSLVAPKKSS